MRTQFDRIRHALGFEAIGLLLIIPLGSFVLNRPLTAIGSFAIFGSIIATVWTFVFTLWFDRTLLRLRGTTARTLGLRILYSLLFEAGLIIVLIPVTAVILGVNLVEAFLIDAGFAGFYLVYSFFYNLAYDALFPDPGAAPRVPPRAP